MIQLLGVFFGKNIESAIITNKNEINDLSEYVANKIKGIDVEDKKLQKDKEAFACLCGSVYIDTCKQIEKEFKLKSPDNYLKYKQKIEIMIAKKVRKIAKQKQKEIYLQLLQPIQSQYNQLDVSLSEKKNIRLLIEQYQQKYVKLVQNIYYLQPETMDWILIKFVEKLKKYLIFQSFEIQRIIINQKDHKSIVQDYIHTYFISQQFWMLNKNHIIQLIQFSQKLDKSKFQDVQQGFERFILEISNLPDLQLNENDFNQIINQQKQNQGKYFFEDFSAEQTIQLIIEIFIVLSGFQHKNQSIHIEKYEPSSYAFLLKFCQEINDGKWEFTNSYILKLADKVMGDIHYQIVQQLNQKQKNQVVLDISNEEETFELFNKDQYAISNFKDKNLAYYYSSQYQVTDPQKKIDKILIDKFSPLIETIVQQQQSDLKQYRKPAIFYLQSLSKGELRSNVITIFANGFITQSDKKIDKLWPFKQNSYHETLALGWSASSTNSIFQFAGLTAILNMALIGGVGQALLAGVAGSTLIQFDNAYKEAKIVGKYLAYFLDQNYLGTKSINLIGFSLGTVIVYYCLKQLIKLQKQQNKEKHQIIHNVLMMGGVADKNLLAKLDFRCISGTFHNVYSEKDKVLRFFLPLYQTAIKPCGKYHDDIKLGLNSVDSMHLNVKNHNFTKKVSGHLKYQGEITQEILKLTNFDDQYLIS